MVVPYLTAFRVISGFLVQSRASLGLMGHYPTSLLADSLSRIDACAHIQLLGVFVPLSSCALIRLRLVVTP